MSTSRKPRPGLETQLSEAQQNLLCDWIRTLSYEKIVALAEKEFGIKTTTAAISRFWDSTYTPLALARRARAVSTSAALAAEIKRKPGQWDRSVVDSIKETTFSILQTPGVDPGDVAKLTSLFLQTRNLEIKKEQLALQRRRVRLLEKQVTAAKEIVANEKLSPEQLKSKLGEIYGVKLT